MNNGYDGNKSSVQIEGSDETKSIKKRRISRKKITVLPVKKYDAAQIKAIRNQTGMSQRLFASYMGVSTKTVEAWEAGINHPSGAASRILNMMELNHDLITEYPFVQI